MAKIMGIIVFMNNEVNIDEVKKDLANEVTIDQVIDGTIIITAKLYLRQASSFLATGIQWLTFSSNTES